MKLLIWIRYIISEKWFDASIIGRLQNDMMIQVFLVHIFPSDICYRINVIDHNFKQIPIH